MLVEVTIKQSGFLGFWDGGEPFKLFKQPSIHPSSTSIDHMSSGDLSSAARPPAAKKAKKEKTVEQT